MFDAKNDNRMNMKGKNILRYLATAMLGLLGFSSCSWLGIGVCMYGEPHADFKALGTVKDDKGKPIEGIRVAVQQHRHYANTENVIYDYNDMYYNDTVYTDSNGKYELVRSVFEAPQEVTVVFEDIDGEEHGGEFGKTVEKPAVVQTKKGDKSWYGGAYQVEADTYMVKK